MKKLLICALAAAVTVSLCACQAAQKTKTPSHPTAGQRAIAEAPESTEPTILLREEGMVEGVEEMLNNPLYPRLRELMGFELTDYPIDHAHSGAERVAVMFKEHQLIVPDYTFELGDGSRLSLPMTYRRLVDSGWQLNPELNADMPSGDVPGQTYQWYSFVNSSGNTINAEIGNYSASPVALKDAVITQLQFGNIHTESFSVKGIQAGSTVQEVIEQFGLPFECSYYKWEDGVEHFSFYYINDINYSSISFEFDTETGLLDNVCYSVLLHPDERPA